MLALQDCHAVVSALCESLDRGWKLSQPFLSDGLKNLLVFVFYLLKLQFAEWEENVHLWIRCVLTVNTTKVNLTQSVLLAEYLLAIIIRSSTFSNEVCNQMVAGCHN